MTTPVKQEYTEGGQGNELVMRLGRQFLEGTDVRGTVPVMGGVGVAVVRFSYCSGLGVISMPPTGTG